MWCAERCTRQMFLRVSGAAACHWPANPRLPEGGASLALGLRIIHPNLLRCVSTSRPPRNPASQPARTISWPPLGSRSKAVFPCQSIGTQAVAKLKPSASYLYRGLASAFIPSRCPTEAFTWSEPEFARTVDPSDHFGMLLSGLQRLAPRTMTQ